MTSQSFAEFITTRRRELDLTLGDVANSLGVSPITVSNWSSGDSTPKPENLLGLAALLDVPADDLAKMAGVELKPPVPEAGVNPKPPMKEAGVNLMPTAPAGPDRPTTPSHTDDVGTGEPVAAMAEPPAPRPVEKAPASVATPAAATRPAVARARPAPPATERSRPAPEREVLTLPLTYIEDPRQLMRYRIRWALTVVVLVVMFVVLLWASRELVSALSEIKQAVTPGGGSVP